ncbi:mRNA (guanine-N7-)-methyltransferase [Antheraea assamensis cypovirus 4]|uniref:mRNA (Guanine-N7-)-methyltransferase n=1 Tax=Antheraea assamensis cypovirus 4 TaxID=180166 RepID=A0AAE9SMF2_9REOV|nr:mRNA (guanine-N7-)-methyltransferase [Antheraea assamensis cypovirus 4]WPN08784.1 mRNA (guanine-N7-)-methyltransferase [Cypovirus 4]
MASLDLLDDRELQDPQAFHYTRIIQENSSFTVKYDHLGKHTITLTGLIRYFPPLPYDLTHDFYTYPTTVKASTYDRSAHLTLFREFIQTLKVSIPTDVTETARLSLLLAGMFRVRALPHNLNEALISNSSLLIYEGEKRDHLLNIITLYGIPVTGTTFKYLQIPSLNVTTAGEIKTGYMINYYNVRSNEELQLLLQHIGGTRWMSCHIEMFAFDVFHTMVYQSEEAAMIHAWRRLIESWNQIHRWVNGNSVHLKRRSEIMIPLSDSELLWMICLLHSQYLIDRIGDFAIINIERRKIESLFWQTVQSEGLPFDPSIDEPLLSQAGDMVVYYNGIILPKLPMALERFIAPPERLSIQKFYSQRDIIAGDEHIQNVSSGGITHIMQPTGDLVEIPEPFSTPVRQNAHVVPVAYDSGVPNNTHGISLIVADVDEPNLDEVEGDLLEYAAIIDTPPSDNFFNVNKLSRPIDVLRRTLQDLVRKWERRSLDIITAEELFILRIGVPYLATSTLRMINNDNFIFLTPLPVDATVNLRQFNNSTPKMYAMALDALELYKLHYAEEMRNVRPDIMFLGVENEPTMAILREYHASDFGAISGVGDRAKEGRRVVVTRNPFVNLTAHIMICDIDNRLTDVEENITKYRQLLFEMSGAMIVYMKLQTLHKYNHTNLTFLANTFGFETVAIRPNMKKIFSHEAYLRCRKLRPGVPALRQFFSPDHAACVYSRSRLDDHDISFRFHLLGEPSSIELDSLLNDTRSTVMKFAKVHQKYYKDAMDILAQVSETVVTWKISPADEFINMAFKPAQYQKQLFHRRIPELVQNRQIRGHYAELIPTGLGVGHTASIRTFGILRLSSVFTMVKYVAMEHMANLVDEWMRILPEDAQDRITFFDIGGHKRNGRVLIEKYSRMRYVCRDINVIDDPALASYNIGYDNNPWIYAGENASPMEDYSIYCFSFVLESPSDPNDLTMLQKLAALRDRHGTTNHSLLLVTFLNDTLGPLGIANDTLENFHAVRVPSPDVEGEEAYAVTWGGYQSVIVANEDDVMDIFEGENYEVTPVNAALIPRTIYRRQIFPRLSHNGILPDLLRGVTIVSVRQN